MANVGAAEFATLKVAYDDQVENVVKVSKERDAALTRITRLESQLTRVSNERDAALRENIVLRRQVDPAYTGVVRALSDHMSDRMSADAYIRAIQEACEHAFTTRHRFPKIGKAGTDVHRLLALVGRMPVRTSDDHAGDSDSVEINGIPIFRSDDVPDCAVELGFGADLSAMELRVTVGTGITNLSLTQAVK